MKVKKLTKILIISKKKRRRKTVDTKIIKMKIYILLINCFLIGSTISLPSDDEPRVVQHVSVSVSNSTEIRNKKVDIREPAAVQESVEEDGDAEERDDSNFRTSHAINFNGVPFPRESSASKYLKPQIDTALGEMIGENIRNIIDSHHSAEDLELSQTATTPANVVNINDINLLEAGSETKHKSRIVTKKAENGKEYEYEYYYYYEDEGEDDNDEVVDEKENVKPDSRKKPSNIDTKSNDIPKVLNEEEQPIYTRFPPRDNVAKATTQQVTTTENAITDNRKHHVKRPSLELVDSHSFNTNDKKSTTRNFESESSKSDTFESNSKSTVEYDEKLPVTKSPAIDTTTRDYIMHKSAMDLYAILANENLNSENEVIASESSTTTEIPEETSVATSKPTTTRTTTTVRTTTTTTTTTTAAPAEPKSPFSRNSLALRNRGRNNQALHEHKQEHKQAPASTTTTTTHAPASENGGSTFGSFKPRGRFNKASASAPRARPTATQKEETTEKKETEAETSQPKPIGRTRNRFNLKPAITRTTTDAPKESHDEAVVTAGRSSLVNRPRPTFASRGRANSRITTSSAAATEATTTSQAATQEASQDQEATQEETKPPASPTQSRLNNRLGITRRNPLLVRKQQEAKEAQEKHDEKQKELNEGGDSSKPSESGVNKLKSRPRITIAPSHEKHASRPSVQINRRVNPLLKNRHASTTVEPATVADDKPVVEELEEEKEEAVTESEAKEEAITEAPTPKPHGLAALRRKIVLRQPGKLK